MPRNTKIILPIIVISQFFCTSLWFAGNGVINDIVTTFNLKDNALGHLTSAVQFGFIIGTLIFAILTIVDRFSPSKVFFTSAFFGALLNLGVLWDHNNITSLLSMRFFTGFFLAGIYPVGMKIAADYYKDNLGKSLGFLVGALVLGTAFPHLLKNVTGYYSWKYTILTTSILAFLGGLIMLLFVPNGPFRKPSQKTNLFAFFKVFHQKEFRSAAFGYFGHMWELYAFWAFVPVILKQYSLQQELSLNISLWSFIIIATGSIACIFSGYISKLIGIKRTAFIALFLSCLCCIISPLILGSNNEILFLSFLIFWAFVVIADSPLLSTLVAQNAPVKLKGTALTIVNCIGFSITIISIQYITSLTNILDSNKIYMVLAIGPVLGLISLRKRQKIVRK
ncbi:MFS transporter [Tenacibaculum todarodis]|uniref:MFS transporter n=1 Tax=Tenacibaculum todarodis TaxID=1850252 RepID=A0A1L3JKK2_9FLAO|nr:MFS transporter [Tenacibaculum todarodis]APG65647.1 MFS transporter [Tenacibaculum todarodis]